MTFDLVQLRNLLDNHFNEDELRDLCFELRIDYDTLRPGGKKYKARELVQYTERLGRTEELVERCRQMRPLADWPAEAGTTHPTPTTSTLSPIPSPTLPTADHPRSTQPSWAPELVHILAGPFLMGSSQADIQADLIYEGPQHCLELPNYWIGKTPVTNAQFRPFVDGDGYHNKQHWTVVGWQWCESEQLRKPRYWDDALWNGDTQPVVGVSWFEAVAYCRWLSTQTGHEFRLPSEAEWEKAARGPDGRIWPWGNTWEAGRCNSWEVGIMQTTPVKQYPIGASPYGALDMAGNVYEWCVTRWKKFYPYQIEHEWWATDLERDNLRVIRGGSWDLGQKFMRGACRSNGLRHGREKAVGFRIASHSRPDSGS